VKAENLDAVFANQRPSQPNQVCLGDGTGGFVCSDVNDGMFQSTSVALGLLDGDGNLDAVFGIQSNKSDRVCFGDGSGGFDCKPVSADVRLSRGVALGFMNNDSFLDAVFANQNPINRNQVCLGDGTGGFVCSDVDTVNPQSNSVALGLLDGDGNLDAVFGTFLPSDSGRVCFGDGNGGLSSCTAISSVGSAVSTLDVALGFVDDDSILDVAFALDPTGCSPIQQVCYGAGDGTFPSCLLIDSSCQPCASDNCSPCTNGTCESIGVALGKVFAGTGLDKIVFANGAPNVLCGDQSFQIPFTCTVVSPSTLTSLDVALGLVDDDSFLDAVFANNGLNQVCLGDGSGGFSCSLFDSTNSRGVALGDFNPPPTSCCVIGENDCVDDQDMTQCDAAGGSLDVDTFCDDIPECNVPLPGEGCCVLGVNDCINDQTADECNEAGGAIEIGVSCPFVPTCNNVMPPPRNVPTLSEWGLIAMAGILGIVGFMVIRRRKATA